MNYPPLPFVSVIVPMYNVEKYIGELLDSLLAQTLKNFELIILDNGSTDNSAAIVESYAPKFDNRLSLLQFATNMGGPSLPRNKGLEFSRGKYIYFMDSDDVLTDTALEEMYTVAEDFQADVVYCEKYFRSGGIGEEFKRNIHFDFSDRIQLGGFVNKPEMISTSVQQKVLDWMNYRFWMTPWLRLSSRDFLVNNNIKFPLVANQNDHAWAFENLILAERFVRIPNACYIRRMHEDSLSGIKKTANEVVKRWMEKTINGLKELDSFMVGVEFFQKNPNYRYAVLECWAYVDLINTAKACLDLPANVIYEIFKDEFKDSLGENDVLVSYLATSNIMFLKRLIIAEQESKNGEKK